MILSFSDSPDTNFVIGLTGLPALPDHAYPFESEGAHGGVMFFAFGPLHGVVSAGPEGMLNRLGGVLVKGLAQELGTEVAPANPGLFAAALDDQSDAGEAHQLISIDPTTTVGPESGS